MKNDIVKSVEAEFRRYKAYAEGAFEQVPDHKLSEPGTGGGNSLAILCWHISGNLKSRFTDFLSSDGEKPWREREEEFAARSVSRSEFMGKWAEGWEVLFATLDSFGDDRLSDDVQIRRQPMKVHEALHRSLSHVSYHVGQIVYIAHAFAADNWRYLSIPPGGSASYNATPTMEKPLNYVAEAEQRTKSNADRPA
ncbi:MAG: DUF1572 family protein [Thermoanaerobaculia bacterium]